MGCLDMYLGFHSFYESAPQRLERLELEGAFTHMMESISEVMCILIALQAGMF